ncbi:hypothetical protein JX265_011314 [Neoarthrinium moseri]|uniref:N-acetyltransferase domain-containing protein n=1 Tax=Neoarthrinium moseri TaxID=1658444 RepID=A0A9Q0AJR5_9PEZI|nr:uncharacterized protein JN550_013644 [Neoarthrinium moseri]KAI1844778.1 hypothetical protein JX266_009006 [Neoarthrinium moseri]KAI1856870.1 hypothetical protein JN550_013644 [Neoarthrinium moseri]KAI1857113.1 hypothetical protein JX265_011314 [Neoarthrinium moseri]
MAMESMVTAFANAFKSKRLVFRQMEDNDTDRTWLWKNLWSDPVGQGLSNYNVFVPSSEKTCKKDYESIINNSLIAVFICLPPEPAAEGGDDDKSDKNEEGEKKKKQEEKEDEPKPRPIGMLVLSKPKADTFKMRTAIGLQIAAAYQNKGYGREAVNWALDWAFTFGNMHRVDIGTPSFNERALALYESIGFKLEGRTREVFFMNRRWWDDLCLGMLVHEWEDLRGLKVAK